VRDASLRQTPTGAHSLRRSALDTPILRDDIAESSANAGMRQCNRIMREQARSKRADAIRTIGPTRVA